MYEEGIRQREAAGKARAAEEEAARSAQRSDTSLSKQRTRSESIRYSAPKAARRRRQPVGVVKNDEAGRLVPVLVEDEDEEQKEDESQEPSARTPAEEDKEAEKEEGRNEQRIERGKEAREENMSPASAPGEKVKEAGPGEAGAQGKVEKGRVMDEDHGEAETAGRLASLQDRRAFLVRKLAKRPATIMIRHSIGGRVIPERWTRFATAAGAADAVARNDALQLRFELEIHRIDEALQGEKPLQEAKDSL